MVVYIHTITFARGRLSLGYPRGRRSPLTANNQICSGLQWFRLKCSGYFEQYGGLCGSILLIYQIVACCSVWLRHRSADFESLGRGFEPLRAHQAISCAANRLARRTAPSFDLPISTVSLSRPVTL